jgi:Xaa-Pro aminopeptidase
MCGMTPFMPPRRRQQLARAVKADGLDGLLVSSVVHVTYLTGFTGDSSLLLVPPRGKCILVSDGRYSEQIAEECGDDLEVVIRPHDRTVWQEAARTLPELNGRNVGIESQHISVAELENLRGLCKGHTFAPTQGLVEALRVIKDDAEVAQIRSAIRAAERAYDMFRATLKPDETEVELADALEGFLRRAGSRSAAFAPMVAVGPRSALPHAPPTTRRVDADGWLLLDWGASVPLYKSDLTRILRLPISGPDKARRQRVESKLAKLYTVVLTAQAKAIAAVRPGVPAKEVDAAARSSIAATGYGGQFTHGLGHGIGLQIHEGPAVRANSDDVLRAGMVCTIEPGVYLPGWGGVRIEDDVLVTPDGGEVLTRAPRDWDATLLPG